MEKIIMSRNISMGINMGHDRGAAIVCNGILLGAIAQERIDRIKHSSSLSIPFEAIDSLLNYLHISINEISCVGISCTSVDIPNLYQYTKEMLSEHYHHNFSQVIPVTHHLAHAEACFNTSDFDEAFILVADGGGDVVGKLEESESLFHAEGGNIFLLERRLQSNYIHGFTRPQMYNYPFMNLAYKNAQISLGKKYGQITALLGFGPYGAGKTMGLASYGTDLFQVPISKMNSLQFSLGFTDILETIYNLYKESNISYYNFLSINKENIAHTIQSFTERQTCEIIDYIVNKYHPQNLCLTGGLFLNCPLNYKIICQHPDISIHICPSSGDEGQSIGAAYAAYKVLNSNHAITPTSKVLPYLGIDYTSDEIENSIKMYKLNYEVISSTSLAQNIANEIYQNKIVGLLHGRSENGPRALCHRSILANPCNPCMKDILNICVKHRETFRPFAPVVTEERQYDIFDIIVDSPYMLLSAQVKEPYKQILPAITHIDGSARIQSVNKNSNLLVHNILTEFEKLSGIPVLLNTSFNDNNEPMVESPNDAISTFLHTNIDVLFMENFKITKSHTSKGI
jgi:carbamoyltransferase